MAYFDNLAGMAAGALGAVTRTSTASVGSGGRSFLQYPSKLGTMARHEHYVMFFINVQANSSSAITFPSGAIAGGGEFGTSPAGVQVGEKTTLSVARAPTKQLAQAIALYMPSQITVSHKAKYGEIEIGAGVAAVLGTLKAINSNMDIGTLAKEIGSSAITEGGKELGQGILKGLEGAGQTGALGAYEISQGQIRNNRTEMKFEGIDRRSFTFTFTMMPTSQSEANAIEKIVTAFRYHAMPEIAGDVGGSRTMISPSTFDIEYKPNPHLHKISTSVLESVDVKYGGDRPQFFVDGHPVQTELTLQFKELEIITKSRINSGY